MYLDGVIVSYPSGAQHIRDVNEILGLIQKAGVTIKLEKCQFFKGKVSNLGHTIIPSKLAAVVKPENKSWRLHSYGKDANAVLLGT